jgi:hypothetical protein
MKNMMLAVMTLMWLVNAVNSTPSSMYGISLRPRLIVSTYTTRWYVTAERLSLVQTISLCQASREGTELQIRTVEVCCIG